MNATIFELPLKTHHYMAVPCRLIERDLCKAHAAVDTEKAQKSACRIAESVREKLLFRQFAVFHKVGFHGFNHAG